MRTRAIPFFLGLAFLLPPHVAPAQTVQPSPIDQIRIALLDLQDRLVDLEDDVDGLKASDFAQVTNFLGFSSCLDSTARLDGSTWFALQPIFDFDAHFGIDFFGSGAKVKGKARVQEETSVQTGGGSGLLTKVCVDWLKLGVYIENQVTAARSAGDEAQRLAALPAAEAISASAQGDLDTLLADLPDPTQVAEDLLFLVSGFGGTLNPSGVIGAAGATASAAFGLEPDVFRNPEEIFARTELLPVNAGFRDELRSVADVPARFANVNPCASPIGQAFLGPACGGSAPIDPDTFLASIDGLGGLPARIAALGGAIEQLETLASEIDGSVGRLGTTLAGIDGDLGGIGAGVAGVGASVAGVGNRVAGVSSSVQALGSEVTALQGDVQTTSSLVFGELDSRFTRIADGASGAAAGFDELLNTAAGLNVSLSSFRNAVEPVIAALDSAVSNLSSSVAAIRGIASGVVDLVDSIRSRIDRAIDKLNDLV